MSTVFPQFKKIFDFAALTRQQAQVFGPAFFKRLVGMEGAKPLPRPPQRANFPTDSKRSGREAKRPGGTLDRGEPYQGVPRRTQSCHYLPPTINRAARRNGKGLDSLARFFVLVKLEVRHAAIFSKLRPRGHPRAAFGPPFPIFGLRPRRNGVGFRPLRRARRGAAPPPCQPFRKRLDRKLIWVFRRCFTRTQPPDAARQNRKFPA